MAEYFKACPVADCNGNAHSYAKGAKGFCKKHYYRLSKYGDPLGGPTTRGDPRKFYDDVVLPYDGNDCLIWPYARNPGGYGLIRIEGTLRLVTRILCESKNGPPPSPQHHAAHYCGKGHLGCVTKDHLSWKTPKENQADRIVHGTSNRGERHCRSGE